jgi:hypothetical protein
MFVAQNFWAGSSDATRDIPNDGSSICSSYLFAFRGLSKSGVGPVAYLRRPVGCCSFAFPRSPEVQISTAFIAHASNHVRPWPEGAAFRHLVRCMRCFLARMFGDPALARLQGARLISKCGGHIFLHFFPMTSRTFCLIVGKSHKCDGLEPVTYQGLKKAVVEGLGAASQAADGSSNQASRVSLRWTASVNRLFVLPFTEIEIDARRSFTSMSNARRINAQLAFDQPACRVFVGAFSSWRAALASIKKRRATSSAFSRIHDGVWKSLREPPWGLCGCHKARAWPMGTTSAVSRSTSPRRDVRSTGRGWLITRLLAAGVGRGRPKGYLPAGIQSTTVGEQGIG